MLTHQSVREVGATGRRKLSGVGSVFCCFCSGATQRQSNVNVLLALARVHETCRCRLIHSRNGLLVRC